MFGSFPSQRARLKLHTSSSMRDLCLIFTCMHRESHSHRDVVSIIYIYKAKRFYSLKGCFHFAPLPKTFRPKISVLVNPSVVGHRKVFYLHCIDIITTQKMKPRCVSERVFPVQLEMLVDLFVCVAKSSHRYFCGMSGRIFVQWCPSGTNQSDWTWSALFSLETDFCRGFKRKTTQSLKNHSFSHSCYSGYLHMTAVAGVWFAIWNFSISVLKSSCGNLKNKKWSDSVLFFK